MNKCTNTPYRIGTTGTLDGSKTHKLVLEGTFGRVHKVTTTKKLMDDKQLANLKIICCTLNYKNESLKIKENNQRNFLVDELAGLEDISHSPSQSMFYQVKDGKDITVNYFVYNSYTEKNIYFSE